MDKQNVLYFTMMPLDSPTNGGTICCLNHIFRMNQDSKINLFVVATGKEKRRQGTALQLDKIGVKHYFVPFKEETWRSWTKLKQLWHFGISMVFPYQLEFESFNQEHISKYIVNLCEQLSIQVVVVESLYSILFFKDFLNLKQKKVYLAVNREAELYLGRLQQKKVPEYLSSPLSGFISYLRLEVFEKKVHKLADQFIAITKADVPSYLEKSGKSAVISHYLDAKPVSWHYTGSGTIFFAGQDWHYPNYLAIQWLLCELAPKLLKLNSKIKIIIAGTAWNEVPENWLIENAILLGFIPKEKIEHLFQTSDMFICPIKNDIGVKIKAVETVSYGTPLYATAATLKGLPYLLDMPVLDLNNPEEAANYICSTLAHKDSLKQLSQKILKSVSELAIAEKDRWGKTILA